MKTLIFYVIFFAVMISSLILAWNSDEQRINKCESLGGRPDGGSCLVVENNKIVELDIKEYNGRSKH